MIKNLCEIDNLQIYSWSVNNSFGQIPMNCQYLAKEKRFIKILIFLLNNLFWCLFCSNFKTYFNISDFCVLIYQF
jgi:hypothetical protein